METETMKNLITGLAFRLQRQLRLQLRYLSDATQANLYRDSTTHHGVGRPVAIINEENASPTYSG